MNLRRVIISPEVLKLDLSGVTFSGNTFGYYPPLSKILSGGRNGNSLLTEMSIPILFTQDYQDIGYYSPFDGDISNCNEEVNFVFKKGQLPRQICLYNSANKKLKYLKSINFFINWGDNSTIEEMTNNATEFCHVYPNASTSRNYNITVSGQSNLGILKITKSLIVPYTTEIPMNPNGVVSFVNNLGGWSNTPNSQNYINNLDSQNTIDAQITENFGILPFPYIISGSTTSRISELFIYGPNRLAVNKIIKLADGTTGKTDAIVANSYTSYTMNDMSYIDFEKEGTIFVVQSYGITSDMIVESAITKFDYLMNIVNSAEIQSNVFIERGKNSAMESFMRIGEVGSTGEIETYGYKYFDIRPYNDI